MEETRKDRMSRLDRRSTVAEIVLDHSECAQVFCDHRIDFCCRGERSLEVSCAEKSIDVEVVLRDLEAAIAGRRTESAVPDPRALPTPELIAYIVSRHHAYLMTSLPFVETLATKVARVHGAHNPKLLALRDAFADLAATLEPHMREEEGVLFPALRAEPRDAPLVAAELASMDQDHKRVGVMLASVRELADDFTAPDWACGSYRTLMSELAALEMDTLRHVHLETHVLMPRFTAAEVGRAEDPAQADLARLRTEHGNVARLLLVLESQLATIHAGDEYDARLIHDALAYLLEYVDRFHSERDDLIATALAIHQPTLRASVASLASQNETVRASGAELGALLERVIDGGLGPRAELVRHGFVYCTALRRSMALEEAILDVAAKAPDASPPPRSSREPRPAAALDRADEDRYRALFEALTHRVGCDCSYVRST
jgi:regulator of cell morphogenesis and NO signaling